MTVRMCSVVIPSRSKWLSQATRIASTPSSVTVDNTSRSISIHPEAVGKHLVRILPAGFEPDAVNKLGKLPAQGCQKQSQAPTGAMSDGNSV